MASRKNALFVSVLLNQRKDVDINQIQAIELQSNKKSFLIESRTPLYNSIDNNSNEIANILSNKKIKYNIKLKICYFNQKTTDIKISEKKAFHLAVEKGNIDMIEKLLSFEILR